MRTIASTSAVPENAQHALHGFWSRTVVIQFAPQRLRQSSAAGGAPASPGSGCTTSTSSPSRPTRRSMRGEKRCRTASRVTSPTSARRAARKTFELTPSSRRSKVPRASAGRRPSSLAPMEYIGSGTSSANCAGGCQPSCSFAISRRSSPKVMAMASAPCRGRVSYGQERVVKSAIPTRRGNDPIGPDGWISPIRRPPGL